ncbi:hypothetical protein IC232_10235 [Microvirga sp. BT688]|nr:hypothetical protein [Microvirga sp.]MBD2747067.1 hypothetical protein [Microvirga sp.]
MSSLSYIFYGGVEGAYQNDLVPNDEPGDSVDPRFLELGYGAAVGG